MAHFDVEPIPGYEPSVGLLLASLADSTREWRGELGEPPIEAIVWQTGEGMQSIGGQLLHLIDVEVWWFETFSAGLPPNAEEMELLKSKQTVVDDNLWPTPPAHPIGWYYDLHDKLRNRAWEAIRSIEPERVYQGREHSFTFRWILSHVVQHDAYHGGQAVLLHQLWNKGVR